MKSFLSITALAQGIKTTYGFSGARCQLIKGTIRDTYLITSSNDSYILCVFRHNQRSVAEIIAELDFLDYLKAEGLAVAPAIPQKNGERLWAIPAPEGIRYAVLYTYIEGQQLSKTPGEKTVWNFGRAVAQVHTLADAMPSTLSRPPNDFELLVDRSITAIEAAIPHRVDIITYLHEVVGTLRPRVAALPTEKPCYGLIHGDVIPSNVQVSPNGGVTLLDFDFFGPGWRAYDVATYLSEVRFWNTDETMAQAFLDGYQDVRPLSENELATIPLLGALRNIFSFGVPASYVDTWGSAYLSERLIGGLLSNLKHNMADLLQKD